jgi:lipoprotein-anchoring transpeptidase ErfK/SrfK
MANRTAVIGVAIAALVGGVVLAAATPLIATLASRAGSARVATKAAPVAVPTPRQVAAVTPRPSPTPLSGRYVVRHVLPIEGAIKLGEWHWSEEGAPATGEIVITVDLAAQVLSIFRDGYEIGAAAILYGADAKPTPLGVYPVTQKDADHHSNLYGWAPMPYMLRLTDDGVSIHGSNVAQGYMTHGCIGVPIPFAKKLFAATKIGDRVIVTRGETLDVGQPIAAVNAPHSR